MIPVQPNFLERPFAQNGDKNNIPSMGGDLSGFASLNKGFPVITETPIEFGGIPPQRKDFNAILYILSKFAFYAQGGGVFTYSETANYNTPAVVMYENVFYFCIKENGVDSDNGVNDPTDTEYWVPLINYLLNNLTVGTPIGTIIMWASSSNPQDGGVWLDCNGQSCTNYPALVSVLGSNNVPNLSGLFPRCVGSQTINNTTYGNVTHTASTIGTVQEDAIRNITGSFSGVGQHYQSGNDSATLTGTFYRINTTDEPTEGVKIDNSGNRDDYFGFDASLVVPTATENRPANMALRFLIKAE